MINTGIFRKLHGSGNRGYEPGFHAEIDGIDRIIDTAISGVAGEYRLGKIALEQPPVSEISVALKPSRKEVTSLAIEPSTKKLINKTTGYVPSYTLEAAIESYGSRQELPVGIDFLKAAGFKVTEGNNEKSCLLIRGGNFPNGALAKYFGTSQTATLTYSQNAAGLTAEEVGKTIRSFTRALECVVNGIYKAAGKSPPDKTLSLKLGEKISRIKEQKIHSVATSGDIAKSGLYSEKADEKEFAQALQPTKSDVTFKDIGGYQSVKEQLGDFLLAIKNPQEARRHGYTPSKGVLLHGPSGTGKTLFGKALAGEADAEFIHYKASDMLKKYVGDSPKALNAAFYGAQKRADETKKPVIVFIDEIDSVFPPRGTAHDVKTELVNLFNQYMDGFESRKIPNVWVVGATNRLREMDESATRAGRFVKIEVPLPDLEARLAILQVRTAGIESEAGATPNTLFSPEIDYASMATRTEGFSGADINGVLKKVREIAFSKAMANGIKEPIQTTQADIENAIAAYKKNSGQRQGSKPTGFLAFKKGM